MQWLYTAPLISLPFCVAACQAPTHMRHASSYMWSWRQRIKDTVPVPSRNVHAYKIRNKLGYLLAGDWPFSGLFDGDRQTMPPIVTLALTFI